MTKVKLSDYQSLLNAYLSQHQALANDYAGMQKIILLFESFRKCYNTPLYAQLRRLKKIIQQCQAFNNRAQSSLEQELQSSKQRAQGNILKRLKAFLGAPELESGCFYLVTQEEEQLHTILKVGAQKARVLLNQMYEPDLLRHLSRIDREHVESLEIFLRKARIVSQHMLHACRYICQDLRVYLPNKVATTSFEGLIQHCNHWGTKVHTRPEQPKNAATGWAAQCAALWRRPLALWR